MECDGGEVRPGECASEVATEASRLQDHDHGVDGGQSKLKSLDVDCKQEESEAHRMNDAWKE